MDGPARRRLERTRRILKTITIARAALWSAVVLVGGALVWTGIERVSSPRTPTLSAPVTGLTVGLITGLTVVAAIGVGLTLARPWRPWSLPAVALWIEARVPTLRYALVTLAGDVVTDGDESAIPAPVARALATRVREADWDDALRETARRALTGPAALLGALALVLLVVPHLAPAVRPRGFAVTLPSAGAATVASAAVLADPLAHVHATVTPPAYARLPVRTLDDPPAIAALVGSALAIEATGHASDLRVSLVTAAQDSVAAATLSRAAMPIQPAASRSRARSTAHGPVSLPVRALDGGRWRVTLPMPSAPVALRLAGPGRDRVVVLDPQPDQTPRVALVAPTRDTVVRAPQGTLPLAAGAEDDLGLVSGGFEYVISSGEGENFTFRTGRLGAATFGGARAGRLAARLDLGALALKPGDLVHVRALARDARPGALPGASATRVIRVARAGEYDSVAVEGAPPPDADTAAFGQRMLLQLTEALVGRAEARRAPLARPAIVAESRTIGADQARLRRRVGDAVFSRTGGAASGEESQGSEDASERRGTRSPSELLAEASRATGAGAGGALEGEAAEAPVTAINRPLLEAYNAMWDAGRALEIGEPRRALAPMRRAIAALERARAAERIYLRGRPAAVVVDLAKVRGAGHVAGDTLHPAARDATPGAAALYPSLDPAARARAAALDRALVLLARGTPAVRAAAVDSLALLRVSRARHRPPPSPTRSAGRSRRSRRATMQPFLSPAPAARHSAPLHPATAGAGGWTAGWQDLRSR